MNWIILLVIAFITSILILGACGVGGGMMALLAMNGMSESAATPVLIIFALVVFGLSIVFSALFGWMYVKASGAEIRLRQIAAASIGVNITLIALVFFIFFAIRMLK
jgi:hypothetical protein